MTGRKGDQPWRIGIQHPRAPAPLATLPLYDGEAIGTSGDYQRYFELDGERLCHLIDPRSGEPVRHTQSLTVLMPAGPQAAPVPTPTESRCSSSVATAGGLGRNAWA